MSKPTLTAAMRWHNPGNISKLPKGQLWQGELDRPGRFAGFRTDFDGLRALAMTLISYERKHGIRTINEAVHRYAPPHENQTGEYQRNLSDWTGFGREEDVSLTANLETFLPAFCRQENGGNSCPLDHYLPELIHEAAQSARKAWGLA